MSLFSLEGERIEINCVCALGKRSGMGTLEMQ
jgi:hypothetical protein